jgi:TonB-dependent receptor
MTKYFRSGILALVFLFPFFLLAQKGTIAGKIIDAKLADVLIGVTVRLDEGAGGAITDFDGNYTIANVPVGKHKITINYTGYASKTIEEIDVKNGEATTVDIAMEDAAATSIAEVVIVARASRESQSALTILQKASPTIGDGISSETIKRTPDRTTGDVIRRVSGASIQDGKFAVIRGLNDRYNIAMLNGALLSSTEPDRKAFSFDLFPSSMLDNLVIVKTASADLPAEFAGGAILVTTKDIPEASFLQANVSGGYNSVTTFKPFLSGENGGSDWLGHDDGSRALPEAFPATADFKAQTKDERYRTSTLFNNDWAIIEKSSARPNMGFQISGGYVTDPAKKNQFGATLGVSYSNNNRLQNGMRSDFDITNKLFDFNDKQFKNNVLWGALFNTALKINKKHKIGLQATYSTNTDNIISDRSGYDYEQQRKVTSTAIEYTENHLLTSRLYGEHQLSPKGMRLSWGGGLNRSTRDVPSLRRMFYFKNFEDTLDVTIPFQAYVPFGSADPYRSGRFYSALEENTYNSNVDLTIPFLIGNQKQSVKIGGLYQKRDRSFDARVMGFVLGNYPKFDYSYLNLPQEQIFATEHIGETGFIMDDITNPSDGYTGQSNLKAGYVLLDNKIADRLRISWGARVENFRQQVQSAQYSGTPLTVDTTITALLPSFNMTYSISEKQQLRFSGSKTVCRAEFRELAPFSFFDFYLNANVVGNPDLTQGSIYNADVRYEVYPGQNQLLSVSLFYKKFKNPIEFTFAAASAGTRTFSFNNVASAKNYGAEIELRKNLDFIGAENLVFFSNASFIRSSIDLSKGVSYFDSTRSLQGQSPYIINAGLTYNMTKIGLSTTLIYNVIGDRVAQVGTVGYGDIYERHRNLLDFSVNKRLGKHGEVKLTWGDILRPEFVYYQDNNASHKYEAGTDNVIQRLRYGSTITLGLGYRF